jgi:hypothetical protein
MMRYFELALVHEAALPKFLEAAEMAFLQWSTVKFVRNMGGITHWVHARQRGRSKSTKFRENYRTVRAPKVLAT